MGWVGIKSCRAEAGENHKNYRLQRGFWADCLEGRVWVVTRLEGRVRVRGKQDSGAAYLPGWGARDPRLHVQPGEWV